MAVLAVVSPDGSPQPHPVGHERVSIGRASDNDLVLDSPHVSRRHAVLNLDADGYVIQDLGSKNGTWVNNTRLGTAPHRLQDGDRIVLGNARVTLRFYLDDATVTVTAGLAVHEVEVDARGREVTVRGQRLSPPLTRKEFDILALLWERRGAACSRDELAAQGWPERPPGDVSPEEIEQYIRRLRRRLGDSGSHPRLIQTIRRYGYKLV